jgi:hypothetical protein
VNIPVETYGWLTGHVWESGRVTTLRTLSPLEGDGDLPPLRRPPLPLAFSPVAAVGRGRRAKPGRRRLFFPRIMEGGSGPFPSLAAVHLGRFWSGATGWLWRRRPTAVRLGSRGLRRRGSRGLQRAKLYSGRASRWWRRRLGGVPGRRLCGQPTAARRPELHGPIWARPGLTGPGVLPLLCPVSDCLSAVEVGPSRMAARLMFLVPTVSCISVVQAVGQCHKATDDGDFEIVVAHAGGWRC